LGTLVLSGSPRAFAGDHLALLVCPLDVTRSLDCARRVCWVQDQENEGTDAELPHGRKDNEPISQSIEQGKNG